MAARRVTKTQQAKTLALVAAWMGKHGMTDDGSPAPTGKDAAYQALGPMLVPDWDWPSGGPTPTILTGGMDDWAYEVSGDIAFCEATKRLGVFAEPYASYALSLYRFED